MKESVRNMVLPGPDRATTGKGMARSANSPDEPAFNYLKLKDFEWVASAGLFISHDFVTHLYATNGDHRNATSPLPHDGGEGGNASPSLMTYA